MAPPSQFSFSFFLMGSGRSKPGPSTRILYRSFISKSGGREGREGGIGAEKRGVGYACEVAELFIVLELFLHTVCVSHPLWL